MREGIGSIFLYNLIIVFIILTFAFLAGTMSYAKAFRVNSKIVNTIEKYEGYNGLANNEINRILNTIGYMKGTVSRCPDKKKMTGVAVDDSIQSYRYCLYSKVSGKYIKYGVVSYIHLDLPIIGDLIKIPIYAETDNIYMFTRL